MAKGEKNKPPIEIETFKYKDRRANIPTEELRDFVVKDETSPKTILYLYAISAYSLLRGLNISRYFA